MSASVSAASISFASARSASVRRYSRYASTTGRSCAMRRPGLRGRGLVTRGVQLGELRLELLQLGLEVDQTFEHTSRLRERLSPLFVVRADARGGSRPDANVRRDRRRSEASASSVTSGFGNGGRSMTGRARTKRGTALVAVLALIAGLLGAIAVEDPAYAAKVPGPPTAVTGVAGPGVGVMTLTWGVPDEPRAERRGQLLRLGEGRRRRVQRPILIGKLKKAVLACDAVTSCSYRLYANTKARRDRGARDDHRAVHCAVASRRCRAGKAGPSLARMTLSWNPSGEHRWQGHQRVSLRSPGEQHRCLARSVRARGTPSTHPAAVQLDECRPAAAATASTRATSSARASPSTPLAAAWASPVGTRHQLRRPGDGPRTRRPSTGSRARPPVG